MKMSKDKKECAICFKKIEDDDSYYLLQSYKLGTYIGKKYYHWKCFNDRIKGDEDLEYIKKHAVDVMKKADKLMEQKLDGRT